ncbi:MAG: serine hydrolase domain-containing protein [Pseudonocardiaceae bacterium]
MAEWARINRVPGAQLAVRNGGVTVAVEVGEVHYGTGIAVTRQTAFPIGSITKVATATLVMILVADGDVELDAPLDTHLPELGELGGRLTVRQLLSHTSGFADTPEQPAVSLRQYVRQHCRREDLVLAPGTGFTYSTRNYVLAGHLIETITGMSWWEAMESILLSPLGIHPAMHHPATGHSVNLTLGRTRPVEQSLTPAEAPAGALAMSATDLISLASLHIPPGLPRLLATSSVAPMHHPVPGADPFGLADGWGAGLAVYRNAWIGHDGNANGTSCYLRIHPTTRTAIALTSNANTGADLWRQLCTELPVPPGSGSRDTPSRPPVANPAECVGSYANGRTEYLITVDHDGQLCLAVGGEVTARLTLYDDLDFLVRDPVSGTQLQVGRFRRNPSTRQIEQLQVGGRIARRRSPPTVPQARSPVDSLRRV